MSDVTSSFAFAPRSSSSSDTFGGGDERLPRCERHVRIVKRMWRRRSLSPILGAAPPLFSLWRSAGKAQQAAAPSDSGDYLLRPRSECLASFLKHPSSPSADGAAQSQRVSPNQSRLACLGFAFQSQTGFNGVLLFIYFYLFLRFHTFVLIFFFPFQLCLCPNIIYYV